MLILLRNLLYGLLYKVRGTPHIKITGLSTDAGQLYDGSLITATTDWWNAYGEQRSGLERIGWLRRFDRQEVSRLARSVNPANRELLSAIATENSPFSARIGVAAINLSYALARTMNAGMNWEEGREDLFQQADVVTPELFADLAHRYGIEADYYYMWEQSPGWWAERERDWPAFRFATAAIRWAYRNQVKRWEEAEGRKLRTGVGWAFNEDQFVTDFTDRLFEQGARFYEAERYYAED